MGGSSSKPIKYLPEFEKSLPSLENKVVAITGCTSGTGLVAAKASVRKGATAVLLLNRPSQRSENAEKEIKAEIPEGQATTVETIPCDLQDFESVRAAAKLITEKYEAVDVLCNNAGVMAMDDYATKDGYDVQMQTNHLSHFLLTKELFPLLQKAKELRGEARIANHSSMARKGKPANAEFYGKNGGNLGGNEGSMFSGGGKWVRYQQTKLANVVFTLALNDKLKDSGIKAVCAAPGYSATDLQTSSQGMNGALWTMVMAQSPEDGTTPLLQVCYGTSVESGDFWEPSDWGNMAGPAVKIDSLQAECTDEASRKVLWEASEEACGKWSL
jgi:NAD(P)-dependent dehydrogenase (short-subunit alcohol dehydrogenase family)